MEKIPLESKLIASAQTNEQGLMILEVAGSISFDAAVELRKEIFGLAEKHSTKRLILNLKQVSYVGSGGFGVMIELLRKFPQERGVVLTHVQPKVEGVIKVMKLSSIFTMAKDDEAALAL